MEVAVAVTGTTETEGAIEEVDRVLVVVGLEIGYVQSVATTILPIVKNATDARLKSQLARVGAAVAEIWAVGVPEDPTIMALGMANTDQVAATEPAETTHPEVETLPRIIETTTIEVEVALIIDSQMLVTEIEEANTIDTTEIEEVEIGTGVVAEGAPHGIIHETTGVLGHTK